MTDNNNYEPRMGRKALEMVMRDVLDGLNDLAVLKAWETNHEGMQILAIEPPDQADACQPAADTAARPSPCPQTPPPDIVPLERYRKRKAG